MGSFILLSLPALIDINHRHYIELHFLSILILLVGGIYVGRWELGTLQLLINCLQLTYSVLLNLKMDFIFITFR